MSEEHGIRGRLTNYGDKDFSLYLRRSFAKAMGFTNELGLTEAWHALRIVNVADGTNEILNRTVAQRLLKGDTEL